MLEIGFDGRDDNPCLHRDHFKPGDRHTHPCVNDDPLVQDAVEDVNEGGAARRSFKAHMAPFG